MPSTGFVLPASAAADTLTSTAWTTPNNVLADDGTTVQESITAKNTPGSTADAGYLRCTYSSLSIPADATITMVEIRADWFLAAPGSGIGLLDLRWRTAGTTYGTVHTNSAEPAASTIDTFDVTAERAWAPGDFNSGTFQLHVRGRNGNNAGNPGYRFDYVAVQVTYADPVVSGTLAATLPALTSSFAGTVEVSGTASATLLALTSSAAGAVGVSGTTAVTLPALTTALAGTVDAGGVSGSLAATLPALSATAAGDLDVVGSAGATLPALGLVLAGVVEVNGTAVVALPALTVALAGSVADNTVRGSVSVTLSALTSSAAGALTLTGVVAGSLPAMTGQFAATASGGPPAGPADGPHISSTRFGRRVAASRSGAFITATPMRRPSERA